MFGTKKKKKSLPAFLPRLVFLFLFVEQLISSTCKKDGKKEGIR